MGLLLFLYSVVLQLVVVVLGMAAVLLSTVLRFDRLSGVVVFLLLLFVYVIVLLFLMCLVGDFILGLVLWLFGVWLGLVFVASVEDDI